MHLGMGAASQGDVLGVSARSRRVLNSAKGLKIAYPWDFIVQLVIGFVWAGTAFAFLYLYDRPGLGVAVATGVSIAIALITIILRTRHVPTFADMKSAGKWRKSPSAKKWFESGYGEGRPM